MNKGRALAGRLRLHDGRVDTLGRWVRAMRVADVGNAPGTFLRCEQRPGVTFDATASEKELRSADVAFVTARGKGCETHVTV